MSDKPTSGIYLCGLVVLCLSLDVSAAGNEKQEQVVIGAATEAILKLQSDGSAAGQLQPVNGDVATRSYQRYLETFTRPIADSKETTGSLSTPYASKPSASAAAIR